MLEKGGTTDPMDVRPIVLLPQLYRLWATCRAKELGRWMQDQGVQLLPGTSRGSEDHGVWVAHLLAASRVQGREAGGVALDFSKAYDTMSLQLLTKIAEACGMPAWLWKPMLSMYRGSRRVAVGGWCCFAPSA